MTVVVSRRVYTRYLPKTLPKTSFGRTPSLSPIQTSYCHVHTFIPHLKIRTATHKYRTVDCGPNGVLNKEVSLFIRTYTLQLRVCVYVCMFAHQHVRTFTLNAHRGNHTKEPVWRKEHSTTNSTLRVMIGK